MKIYTHKVRMSLEDGWGRTHPISNHILGYYVCKEKALDAKNKRDQAPSNYRHCDIGSSWIEEGCVDENKL